MRCSYEVIQGSAVVMYYFNRCFNPYTGNGEGGKLPPSTLFVESLIFPKKLTDMTFYDIVTHTLACLKLLKLFKYLLLLSWGMTGKSGRRLGYLPIPCVVQLYDF